MPRKFHEFVKTDPAAIESLRSALRLTEIPLPSLLLGGESASIRFADSHFLDLKAVLQAVPEPSRIVLEHQVRRIALPISKVSCGPNHHSIYCRFLDNRGLGWVSLNASQNG